MPTNKLWIEHTERAAWESVEALREKLADAEKRMQRMAPPVEGWQSVFDSLELASQRHALSGSGYAEWIRNLIERLAHSESRVHALESELARLRESGTPITAPVPPESDFRREARPVYLDDDEDLELPAGEQSRSGARFFAAMHRRYKAQVRDAPRSDVDGLVSEIEGKVDDFADLDEPELAEAALDLAVLAMRLERAAKR